VKKIQEIERLRGYAVLLIVFYHQALTLNIDSFFRYSWGGPDLFFVLSGFVISLSLSKLLPDVRGTSPFTERLQQSRTALQIFYVRRVGRILPMAAFWAFVCLLIAFVDQENPTEILKEIFAIFTLQYNYAIPHGLGQSMVEYWSLNVEEHFYLFLPIFFILIPTQHKRFKWTLIFIALVAFVIRPFVMDESVTEHLRWTYLRFTSHRRFDALLAGVGIQLVRSLGWGDSLARIPRWVIGLICLFCLLGIFLESGILPLNYVAGNGSIALWVFSGILVFFASFDQNLVLSFPVIWKCFEYLGSRSYGIYLIHRPAGYLVMLLNTKLLHLPFLDQNIPIIFFTWLLTLFLAEISRRWIELPGIRWSRDRTQFSFSNLL
jgi:peptidoglycan/LPS O-acetylase OafA/YrhL